MSNKLRLPWRVWDNSVIDCDSNGIAWNCGKRVAEHIVKTANERKVKE